MRRFISARYYVDAVMVTVCGCGAGGRALRHQQGRIRDLEPFPSLFACYLAILNMSMYCL